MLRNKEFRQFAFLFACMAVLFVTLGFFISTAAGILTLFSATAFGLSFLIFTKARYKSIAQISEQIDQVLHHTDLLYLSEANEGELSILQSEITKMTLRIREQNDALKKEKAHLADALADIAHQLRTPLTSINLILSLLENAADEKERQALLREIEALFTQMDWLLTALLKIARLDAGMVVFQNGPIEVHTLANAALRPLLIPLELHDVAWQITIPQKMSISGDAGWLAEALQNILKNCLESAGDHGKISIGGEDTPLYAEITIHDSGEGFAQEDLPHLFDRFYRGKKSRDSGYGIGLALCKMIITQQGGTITAKNHPEGGALFVIRFLK